MNSHLSSCTLFRGPSGRSSRGNGLSIAFTSIEGLHFVAGGKAVWLPDPGCAERLRKREATGIGLLGGLMNTATNAEMPVLDAKPAMGPLLVEGHQERDPYDLIPWLPCTLALDIPIVNFTVGDLLSLTKGSIVETAYHQSSDLPLRVNGQLVGWTEFEVVGERLAVRLTDLS